MKMQFGDLPGHEFHGNQWTQGMAAMEKGIAYAEHAGRFGGAASQEALQTSRVAKQIYGAGPKAQANKIAAALHKEVAKDMWDSPLKQAHMDAAAAHNSAAQAFGKAAKEPYPGSRPVGGPGIKVNWPKIPLRSRSKFGRNVVRELNKIGTRG